MSIPHLFRISPTRISISALANTPITDALQIGAGTNALVQTHGLFTDNSSTAFAAPTNGYFAAVPIASAQKRDKTNEVSLTGISTFGGRVVVYVPNGEVYNSSDKELSVRLEERCRH